MPMLADDLTSPIALELIAQLGGIATADPTTCQHPEWWYPTTTGAVQTCTRCPTYRWTPKSGACAP